MITSYKNGENIKTHENHFLVLILFTSITCLCASVYYVNRLCKKINEIKRTNQQHGDRSASASYRSQSPPPAHQTSPLTTVLTIFIYFKNINKISFVVHSLLKLLILFVNVHCFLNIYKN
jgi:hypothetical protein